MYKFFVCVLVVLVLVCVVEVHQGWAEEGKNLIKNGSFEEGKRPWGTSSNHNPHLVSVDPSTSTDGDFSIKLDGRTAENRFIDIYQLLKLKPSTKYLVKMDIKRTESSSDIFALVWEKRDPTEKYKYHTIGINAKSGINQWEHFETEFTTQDKVSDARLYLYNKTNGIAWFDNIELLELSEVKGEDL